MSKMLDALREIAATYDEEMVEVVGLWNEEALAQLVEDSQPESIDSAGLHPFGISTALVISGVVYHVIRWARLVRNMKREKDEAKRREQEKLLLIGCLVDGGKDAETARQIAKDYVERLASFSRAE